MKKGHGVAEVVKRANEEGKGGKHTNEFLMNVAK
jgi:hypothetical protein